MNIRSIVHGTLTDIQARVEKQILDALDAPDTKKTVKTYVGDLRKLLDLVEQAVDDDDGTITEETIANV